MEGGYSIDVLYLNYGNIFDSVPHERLLVKLQAYIWIITFICLQIDDNNLNAIYRIADLNDYHYGCIDFARKIIGTIGMQN